MDSRRLPLPARITLALVLVLIAVVWNFIRLWSSVLLGGALDRYAPSPGATYIGVTGAFWMVVGAVVLWSFWRRIRWAPLGLLGASVGYAAWTWMDRLMFQGSWSFGWPFGILSTAVLLAYMTAVALDPRNHFYFGKEAHERQKQARPAA